MLISTIGRTIQFAKETSMALRLTIGQFRRIGHALLDEVRRQEEAKLLKPGAFAQVQWTLLQLEKRIESLPEMVPSEPE